MRGYGAINGHGQFQGVGLLKSLGLLAIAFVSGAIMVAVFYGLYLLIF